MRITVRAATDVAADPAAGAGSTDGSTSSSFDHLTDVAVVVMDGEIDLFTGPELREQLQLLLEPSLVNESSHTDGRPDEDAHTLPRAVVIDLLHVTFMDSYALGLLVWAHKTARSHGRSTALVADSPHHTKLFDMTGLSKVMPLHPNICSAVASLQLV